MSDLELEGFKRAAYQYSAYSTSIQKQRPNTFLGKRKVCQRHGLPSQDHGEPKRELCRHHGDRLLVDSNIPMPMESPRGSSAIIMEFRRRTHLT